MGQKHLLSLLWSLEFVIQINLEQDTIAVTQPYTF